MLPPLCMSWVMALRNSSQYVLYDLASRSAHSRVANLLPGDQTTVESLPQCLADEVSFHGVSLDEVKDRPQRSRKLEALRVLYVALGQVSVVQYQDSGNVAVAAEIRRDCHVELCGIQIRQVVEAQRRLMAVYTLDLLISVARPECPKDEIRPIGHRKQGEAVDAAVLTDPVSSLDVVGMRGRGESSRLGLLGSEEALLLLGDLKKPPR
jgi:ABC-type transporter Mla MlaB component